MRFLHVGLSVVPRAMMLSRVSSPARVRTLCNGPQLRPLGRSVRLSTTLPPASTPLAEGVAATTGGNDATAAASSGRKRKGKEKGLTLSAINELCKARLSGFVAITGAAGYLAHGGAASIAEPAFTALCVGTFLASGAANTFNQIIEVGGGRVVPCGITVSLRGPSWAVATAAGCVTLVVSALRIHSRLAPFVAACDRPRDGVPRAAADGR